MSRGEHGKAKPIDFWGAKAACWEMTRCPDDIRDDCPAYHHRQYPCWEIEGTYCKWIEWGMLGRDTEGCLQCHVYKAHGQGKPVRLKLKGKGIQLLRGHL